MTLSIQASPSLAAAMTEGLTYLEEYPYACVEQTISSFLPNVLTTAGLQQAGISNPELEAKLEDPGETALQRLYNWQNPDGGWGWWGNQESSLLTSAYVVLGLVEARKPVIASTRMCSDRGLSYLRTIPRIWIQTVSPYAVQPAGIRAVRPGDAGEPDVSNTVKLYDDRQKLDDLRPRLVWHIPCTSSTREIHALEALLSDLNNAAILSATGTHWEEEDGRLLELEHRYAHHRHRACPR